jgi:hypothetical protein
MKCNICGRQTQNEEANFCEYCGGPLRERFQTPDHMPQLPPREQGYPYPENPMNPMQTGNPMMAAPAAAPQDKQVSFLNWLGTYGLFLIPIAGWLVFLIMLFVWSFSGNTPASKKNWARATLIFTAVIIILFIILLLPTYLKMYNDIYQQMQNGTFNYNDYMNSLYNK